MRAGFRRSWPYLAAGMLISLVLGTVLLSTLTRTERGRARILAYTLGVLGGRLNGKLEVGRLDGDLYRGAKLYEIVLRDRQGQVLLAADSAFLDYELPTFIGGDVVLNRVVVYAPDLLLYRVPGDSLWNYQHVLQDTTPKPPGDLGRATIIDHLRLVDADITIRLPWEPDRRLPAAERRRETAAALSDTSRLRVERVPGGIMRTMFIRTSDAQAGQLTISSDERGGTYLRLLRAAGQVELYRGEPLRIRDVRGELAMRSGVIRYQAPEIRLPRSHLTSRGRIDLTEGEPRYDIQVLGEEVVMPDIQWIYPPFPDSGRAEFRLWLETRPEGLYYRMRELRFAGPGTRISGQFGFVLGVDTLVFSDVALNASPLDVPTVQQMLPFNVPVRGLEIGAATIESRAQ